VKLLGSLHFHKDNTFKQFWKHFGKFFAVFYHLFSNRVVDVEGMPEKAL